MNLTQIIKGCILAKMELLFYMRERLNNELGVYTQNHRETSDVLRDSRTINKERSFFLRQTFMQTARAEYHDQKTTFLYQEFQ